MSVLVGLRSRLGDLGAAFSRQSEQRPFPGLYAYRRESPEEQTRIHLRIDPDGRGLLIVNANHVFHLNPTAATMAYLSLEEKPADEAVRWLTQKYKIANREASADYAQFASQFDLLIHPNGVCPIHDLGLEADLPFSARPSAPYRMDLALTYRCNNDCSHCYNARPRKYPELDTDDWKRILDRLWELGIPHIVFTGGEPTLRDDLVELIAHAETNGQITGLNTNGRRLSQPGFVDQLVGAGLDHVQITLESHDPAIHDRMVAAQGAWLQTIAGIKAALASKLFVMTNTTLLTDNSPYLSQTLDYLAELGVPTVGLNALIYSGHGLTVGNGLPEADLPPLLDIARSKTSQREQKLIWYTPTEYCHFDPVQMELGVKGCTAALYNMCVEPDGSVIPCQSYYESLGNLLQAPWDEIWNHPLSIKLRERQELPGKCLSCTLLAECGGGCPLSRNQSILR